MAKIMISFATEDFVAPEHNDAILRLSSILAERGIRGSFHVTGEYARHLRDEQRTDVIDALKKHEIGYHSNTHGTFPFIGEVCENNSWDEAVSILMRTEARGMLDVLDIFDVRPKYYVIEFVKAPQLIYALRNLGVDAIGFSNIPSSGAPFNHYAGSICFGAPHMGVESPPAPDRLDALKKEFDAHYKKAKEGAFDGVIKLFNHPYKFAYNNSIASWVSLNNIYREYDIHGSWEAPKTSLYDSQTFEKLFSEFEQLIDYALSKGDVEFIGTSDLVDQYREDIPKFIDIKIVAKLAKGIRDNFSWQSANETFYSPAEIFGMLVYALKYFAERKELPARVPHRSPLGPVEDIPENPGNYSIPAGALFERMKFVDQELDFYGRMPSAIKINGKDTPPGMCLFAFAEILIQIIDSATPDSIVFKPAPDLPKIAEQPYFQAEEFAREIYPEGFTGKKICKDCRLQSWTYKPAKLKKRQG